jgi:hypothetical protein
MTKVKVSEGLSKKDLQDLAKHSKARIKEYVLLRNSKNPAFKYYSARVLIDRGIATRKFLEFRHVCMNCGDVQEMAGYAIAQTAMGYKVNYTCDCGHVTTLPQIQ